VKDKLIAYFLWFIGGLGALGFHRFYLGKVGTGFLWLFTGGLGMFGSVYDFLTLSSQVEETNRRRGFIPHQTHNHFYSSPGPRNVTPKKEKKESLERIILQVAKDQQGLITPGEVALAGNFTLEGVQKELDDMARKNFCDLRITSTGGLLYYFQEFDPSARN